MSERITLHLCNSSKKNQLDGSNNIEGVNSGKRWRVPEQYVSIYEQVSVTTTNELENCNISVMDNKPNIRRKYIYCTEVDSFIINGSTLHFETAAVLFNNKYSCNVHRSCKLVRRERCRRTKEASTQLYKCNCFSSEIVIQFRHFSSETTNIHSLQNFRVAVCIKKQFLSLFNNHFSRNH